MRALALFLAPFLALVGCTDSHATLVVASDLDNPPFASVDAAGRPAGRDVEMMAALARQMGRPLEWRRMPFEELLPAAERGEVDIVCATLGITPERAARVAFTRPYFETVIALVVADAPDAPTRLADLAGRRVLASQGTTAERAVRLRLPDAELVLGGKGEPATLERLLLREVEAAAMDGPAADALVLAAAGALRRLPSPLEMERYALVVPPGRGDLAARLSAALDALEADGTLARLDTAAGLR